MLPMTPERYEQVRQIFIEVCELDPLRRSAMLDERCAHDEELRGEVEALLTEEDHVQMMRESRLGAMAEVVRQAAMAEASETMMLSHTLGKYRLVRKIGEGGMGTVYEAEQEHPRRTVAVKVVRPGIVSDAMLKRFTHEAHVLGLLQHPGIAQIYDAGAAETSSGLHPYFVMELVRGKPLVQFAREHNLSARQRLELMARIADAVHHAHTKGVVHRDLKPGNILVTEEITEEQTREGTKKDLPGPGGEVSSVGSSVSTFHPKILDFGVARITDSDIAVTTINTEIGQLIGTVPYMSPEQASGDTDQIDTRSDVYALGVVCYELLAGRLPFDLARVKAHEAARRIRDEEPARLSTVNRIFRGDIETIVAKALEKDKEGRYQSAAAFAADIRRYLNDEPIVARPASAMYQLRKFAKRNKALVGGVVGIVFALSVGVATTSYWLVVALDQMKAAQYAEGIARDRSEEIVKTRDAARRSAQRAEVVLKFLQETIGAANPDVSQGKTLTITEVLNLAARRVELLGEQQVEIRAEIHSLLGNTFKDLGDFISAEEHLQTALVLRDTNLGPDHEDTLGSHSDLAALRFDQGLLEEAESLLRSTLDKATNALGPNHRMVLRTQCALSLVLRDRGKLQDSKSLLNEAYQRLRAQFPDDDSDVLHAQEQLAGLLMTFSELTGAEENYREVLKTWARMLGETHPDTIRALNNLALALRKQGRLSEAHDLYMSAFEGAKHVLGEDHPNTLAILNNLIAVSSALGNYPDAESMGRRSLDLHVARLGITHPSTLSCMHSLAVVMQELGRWAEAEQLHRSVLESRRQSLGLNHSLTATSMQSLALVLRESGKLVEAESLAREALEVRTRVLGHEHMDTLISLDALGLVLLKTGRSAEAFPLFEDAYATAQKTLQPDHWMISSFQNSVGDCLARQKKFEEAEQYLVGSVDGLARTLGPTHRRTQRAVKQVLALYKAMNLPDKAAIYRELLVPPTEPPIPAQSQPQ